MFLAHWTFGPPRLFRLLVLLLPASVFSLILLYSRKDWQSGGLVTPSQKEMPESKEDPQTDLHVDTLEAREICRQHGWLPFKRRASEQHILNQPRRKVYDLFMVNDELDWLEIRLNTTYNEVDYFVIVESAQTFTGLSKPLVIRDNWDRFAAYHAKMIYHELEFPPNFHANVAWDREDLQRNAMFQQVLGVEDGGGNEEGNSRLGADQRPNQGDVLIVADVDEIPRPSALRALRLCQFPRRTTLHSQFYYYSYQFRYHGAPWPHPQATIFEGARDTLLPADLRNSEGGSQRDRDRGYLLFRLLGGGNFLGRFLRSFEEGSMDDAAWHCSSCYATMAELMHKLESVSHTWMNNNVFRSRDRAAHRVRHGLDLWDRENLIYDRIENNTDFPSFVGTQPERFRYLLNRDGKSAGFTDYP